MAPTTDGETRKTNIVWLKPAQVEDMRDAVHYGQHGARDEAIVATLYDTGLRRAELEGVNRGMVDLEDETLRIPPGIQKDYPNDNTPDVVTFELDRSGELRTTRALRAYLSGLELEDDAALFPSRKSDRMTGKAINEAVKRAATRADVRPYTYDGRATAGAVSAHTLRHSVAWRMLRAEEGNTLYDVRNRLRHARIRTTEENYDHFNTV